MEEYILNQLVQLIPITITALLTALINNYLQKKKFDQEFERIQRQLQLDIRKTLIQRSHDIYIKFARSIGKHFINQTPDGTGVYLSEKIKTEWLEILFEIYYGSHDETIKKLAFHSIGELMSQSSDFKKLKQLSLAIIYAPVNEFNLSNEINSKSVQSKESQGNKE